MPAMLDDPTAPTIHRTTPHPTPSSSLPPTIHPRLVTLRDLRTTATILPFASSTSVPSSLLAYLSSQLNAEIEQGDTYPMTEPMSAEAFAKYWFQNFAAIMILGDYHNTQSIMNMGEADWNKLCLGSFYIKPNYPGRSSHVCNAGFLVTTAARNRGVGRLMGEAYLDYAPKLGYTYSVFNLVYETNIASCRIWDGLGFKRIGRVKGAGALKSYPDTFVDAIIYGKELEVKDGIESGEGMGEGEEQGRFEKIRYYLRTGKYPVGADRAEKSRLRSAATHYKLVIEDDTPASATDTVSSQGTGDGGSGSGQGGGKRERLMLKEKEVIVGAERQWQIAKEMHEQGQHGGINKTTAGIAEKYHWVRIKETVSMVIKECGECREKGNSGGLGPGGENPAGSAVSEHLPEHEKELLEEEGMHIEMGEKLQAMYDAEGRELESGLEQMERMARQDVGIDEAALGGGGGHDGLPAAHAQTKHVGGNYDPAPQRMSDYYMALDPQLGGPDLEDDEEDAKNRAYNDLDMLIDS